MKEFMFAGIAIFFVSLSGVTLVVAPRVIRTVDNVERITAEVNKRVPSVADAVVSASRNVELATASSAAGIPAIMSAVNGKHGIKEVLLNIDKLTADARQTTITAKNTAAAEKTDIHEAMQAVIRTVEHTDTAFNGTGGVLPAARASLGSLDATLAALGRDGGLVETATGTVAAAKNLLENGDLQRIEQNLADGTEHLNGTAAKAEESMGYVRDTLKPRKLSFWGNVAASVSSSLPGAVWNFLLRWKTQRVTVENPK